MSTPDIPDPLADFLKESASRIIDDLKKSLMGDGAQKQKRRKRAKAKAGPAKSSTTVVEVMISGLQSHTKYEEAVSALTAICSCEVMHDLAEFEILETRIVDQWLIILHFTFLSPLPPDAAKFQTEVVLNKESDGESLIGYKVSVHEA